MFSKKSADCCDCAPVGTMSPYQMHAVPVKPGTEMIKPPIEGSGNPMPSGKTTLMPPAVELAPSTSKVIDTDSQHPFELSRRYESRVKRAADYSWITGQLFYVHADGGLWVLRYAPIGQEDPHGGGVILARNQVMDSYREGDLVTVKGEMLQEERSSIFLGAPLYRALDIQLVDRNGN
jgi:hypothetical protein